MSKKILIWLGLLIVVLGSLRLANQRALSFHFVDEEDHIVSADFMNQGLRLYQDLSVNHQPLVYLGSQGLQKIAKVNSIYLLIKSHRMAIWGYGVLWSLILVFRFGLAGLIFSLVFEGLKYYGFGNLWLMESIVVYPAVYLLGRMIVGYLDNNWPGKWESVWLGVCSFIVAFNLVPLWPWLAVIWLIFLIKNKNQFGWQLAGLLLPTAILFMLVSPVDWFRETIYYNVVYAMPQLSVVKTGAGWLKLILFPWLALGVENSYQAKIIVWVFTGWLITGWLKKRWQLLGLLYGLLILANLRVLSPTKVFYEGFHLLPWLGLLLIGFLLLLTKTRNKLIILGLSLWGLSLGLNKNMPYFWQTNPMDEYQINYGRFDDLNFAVKTLVQPGDRMAVLTSESLIYWQTGVLPATRQVVYYAWEHAVPRLQQEYDQVFKKDNPPEFIYGGEAGDLLKEKYLGLGKDEKPTELFIREDKVENIATGLQELNSRNFYLIEKNKE